MLKGWMMRFTKDSIEKNRVGLLGFEETLGWEPGENQQPSCVVNIGGFNSQMAALLLRTTYAARSDILRAHARNPDVGYSTLLVIFWGLRYASVDE